jgi:hypothetical protein
VTPEEFLAALLKALAALTVLRWPLAGALVAIAADLLDIVVMNYVDLGGGGIRNYHAFDKWTDLFALAAFLAVALRWEGRDRAVAVVLCAARLVGVALFEGTGWRGALILLPNLFETWFLYVCMRNAWLPWAAPGPRRALLAGLVAFKLVQEYVLHGAQVLDRYNLSELLERLG